MRGSSVLFSNVASERAGRKRPITVIGSAKGGGWLLRHVVSGLAATGITPNHVYGF